MPADGSNAGSVHGSTPYTVERLTVDTIREVADRVAAASGFADLIYRESEIDAIWSLADVAVRSAELDRDPRLQRWLEFRALVTEAHDLVPEGQVREAAHLLHRSADLLQGWSPVAGDGAGDQPGSTGVRRD